MDWAEYRKRCESEGLPCLIRPAGIRTVGDHVYNEDDGLLYVNRKPVGRFMTLCRYTGLDICLKPANIDNPVRFEELRWKFLLYLEELYGRRRKIVDKLFEHSGGRKKSFKVMHEGCLHKLTLKDDRDYGRRADGGPEGKFRDLPPLDRMSRIPKDSPGRRLAAQWFALRDRINRYSAIAGNLEHCLLSILRALHPDRQLPRSFNRPCFFQINGRLYPVSMSYNSSQDREYWPNPSTDLPLQVLS